ncbi:energy transducer TonB [Pedobacter sp.]|uniref:energy transducer TonB n=1 Tax=Pedobacter sp. TaxID=1411316 RepID=UPI0031CDFD0A
MFIIKKNTLPWAVFCIVLYFGLTSNAYSQEYSNSNPQFNWGEWTKNPCYKGIYMRVQKAYFNKSAQQWYWNWQIQNRYTKRVAISWVFYDKTKGKPTRTNARHTFEPNEIWKNGSFGSATELSYIFEAACFEFKEYNGTWIDDCSTDPATYGRGYYYAECDNGIPNYKAYNNQKMAGSNQTFATRNTGTSGVKNPQNQQTYNSQNPVYDSRSEVTPAKFNGDLSSFLGENIKYPVKAIESNIQGKVNIKVIIEVDGSINAFIIDGPTALREEALRVVNLTSRNWTPARLNNTKVRYSLTLPISFNLSN